MEGLTIWIRKAGRMIWVKDWYEHTPTILRFYEANKHLVKGGYISPEEKYMTAMLHRDSGKIEMREWKKEFDANGKPTFYYSDNGWDTVYLVCSTIDPILEEIKRLTNYETERN